MGLGECWSAARNIVTASSTFAHDAGLLRTVAIDRAANVALQRFPASRFRKGVEQLGAEGVVQVLRSDRRGDAAPVLAAVRPMQFEVATHRLGMEFGARVVLERLPYTVARQLDDPAQRALVDTGRRSEVLTRTDGTDLALFIDQHALGVMQRLHPELVVSSLVAGTD